MRSPTSGTHCKLAACAFPPIFPDETGMCTRDNGKGCRALSRGVRT